MFRAGNRKRIERALVNIQVISPETVAQGSLDWDDIKLEHRKAFTRMQSRDGMATEFIMDGSGATLFDKQHFKILRNQCGNNLLKIVLINVT